MNTYIICGMCVIVRLGHMSYVTPYQTLRVTVTLLAGTFPGEVPAKNAIDT